MHFVIFGIFALLYIGRGRCKQQEGASWSPFQYQIRRLIVRSREVSKPRDWEFKLSHRFDILQAHRQQCCQGACQISERSVKKSWIRYLTRSYVFSYIETGSWHLLGMPHKKGMKCLTLNWWIHSHEHTHTKTRFKYPFDVCDHESYMVYNAGTHKLLLHALSIITAYFYRWRCQI